MQRGRISTVNGVLGGRDVNGIFLYVARASIGDVVIPGKVTPYGHCFISYNGQEYHVPVFEVLCNTRGSWIKAQDGFIPPGALPAGTDETGEILYIGRVAHKHEGHDIVTIGKVQRSKKCCLYPFNTKEQSSRIYEIFVHDQGYGVYFFRGIDTYPLDVGKVEAHILNNVTFERKEDQSQTPTERAGSDCDAQELEGTLKKFKIIPKTYQNPYLLQVKKIVTNIQNTNFEDGSCLIFCILSHGDDGNQIHAADQPYNLDEDVIKPIIENKSLRGKPKIFIVQACRGGLLSDSSQWDATAQVQKQDVYVMNRDADLLLLCSSFPGTKSWRHSLKGSYFIQTLCKNIKELGNRMDLEDIMTHTTNDVMEIMHQEGFCYESSKISQTPTKHSSMRRKFVFAEKPQ
ncbi:hypothetical protein DMENIID0001_154520 [Sergentomyia squamirostris]